MMHNMFEQVQGEVPREEADRLRHKAAQCRRLAIGIADHQTSIALKALAEEYERDAGLSAERPRSAA
ncbi:MAG: hypothetical protein EOP62_09915 [Sphingomonadales bacterium]|nr:MAG: hypothetical protein EOP62_09915 [Sphingomonadales bacterium]